MALPGSLDASESAHCPGVSPGKTKSPGVGCESGVAGESLSAEKPLGHRHNFEGAEAACSLPLLPPLCLSCSLTIRNRTLHFRFHLVSMLSRCFGSRTLAPRGCPGASEPQRPQPCAGEGRALETVSNPGDDWSQIRWAPLFACHPSLKALPITVSQTVDTFVGLFKPSSSWRQNCLA